MYTFSFIVGNIIPKSVQCILSATKHKGYYKGCYEGFKLVLKGLRVQG